MTDQAFLYVPYWVETALNRNSLPLDTCLDYGKIRQVLSLEDMACLLAFQDIEILNRQESGSYNGTLFSMWSRSINDTQRSEFIQAIVPMSRNTELKIDLLKKLQEEQTASQVDITSNVTPIAEPVYYKMVDIPGDINIIVIYKGFTEFICKADNRYSFVVDQLKMFYVYLKPYQVALLPIFKTYLQILAYKTNTIGF